MKESNDLVYKILNENYDLTEDEKKQLNLSIFCLIKEKLIKKDIPNKKIYYDLEGKKSLENILEIGNTIKDQLVNDGKSLDQTVSVELLNDYIYHDDKEALKKAIYYTHRLRDWIIHKDSYIEGNKLIIKPFQSDINPDPNYTIELDLNTINKMCNKSNYGLNIEVQNKYSPHRMIGSSGTDSLYMIRKKGRVLIVSKETGFATIVDNHDDYDKAISLMKRLSASYNNDGKLPSHSIIFDFSQQLEGKLDGNIIYEAIAQYELLKRKGNKKPVIFKFTKELTKNEKLLRTMLEKLDIDKDQIKENNYYIAAIYNYALNVYAEKDKNKPNPRYFDLKQFKISKIDNSQYKESNEAINNRINNFKRVVNKQTNNLKYISNLSKQREITLELFYNLLELYSKIDAHLTLQKDLIATSIRNSIDHGNISIDPETKDMILYDSEDNTKEINDDNCKIKIETNIEDLYSHLEEYSNEPIKDYSFADVIEELDYIIHNKKAITSLKNNTNIVINLLLERKENLEDITLKEVCEEVKNNLRKELASNIKKSIK